MVERYWAVLNTAVFDQQHKVAYIIHSLLDERSGKPEDITERKKPVTAGNFVTAGRSNH